MTMSKIVRFHRTGGPEVLQIEQHDNGAPGEGEVALRVRAFGLNRAEAMFRAGAYLGAVLAVNCTEQRWDRARWPPRTFGAGRSALGGHPQRCEEANCSDGNDEAENTGGRPPSHQSFRDTHAQNRQAATDVNG